MAPAGPLDRLFAPSPPPSAGINRIRFAGRGTRFPRKYTFVETRQPPLSRLVPSAPAAPRGCCHRSGIGSWGQRPKGVARIYLTRVSLAPASKDGRGCDETQFHGACRHGRRRCAAARRLHPIWRRIWQQLCEWLWPTPRRALLCGPILSRRPSLSRAPAARE